MQVSSFIYKDQKGKMQFFTTVSTFLNLCTLSKILTLALPPALSLREHESLHIDVSFAVTHISVDEKSISKFCTFNIDLQDENLKLAFYAVLQFFLHIKFFRRQKIFFCF